MRTVLVLLLTIGAAADAAAQRRTIAIDDQFRLQDVGNPEISPDGEWVCVHRGDHRRRGRSAQHRSLEGADGTARHEAS